MTAAIISNPFNRESGLTGAIHFGKSALYGGVRWTKKVLDKHTDLISSLGILIISTCLVAAKVFESAPPWLSNAANLVYTYGGIIWLNVQVRDLMKSAADCKYALREHDRIGIIETAAKVVVKGINVILTISYFSAAIIGSAGFPQISLAIYVGARPFALGSLFVQIGSDIRDYYANEKLLADLDMYEKRYGIKYTAQKVTGCFWEIIGQGKTADKEDTIPASLSYRIVRQLAAYTVFEYKDHIRNGVKKGDEEVYALIRRSIDDTQKFTRKNIELMRDGYIAMAICKALPETFYEKAIRWYISMRYTEKMIEEKMITHKLHTELSP